MTNTIKETATFAGGCFWCTEAIFKRLKGVTTVTQGYIDQIETIQIEFDPQIISYPILLEVFFKTHDPTSVDRQGADVGIHYRSAIFYHNQQQKKLIEQQIARIQSHFSQPIVTKVLPYSNLDVAEEFHHNYFERHPDQPYCQVVIDPKIRKLYKDFPDLVKSSR